MTKSDQLLVGELHDAIRTAIGRDRFEVWFDGLVELELAPKSRLLRVSLSDEFSLEQVRRRFGATLRDVCQKLTGESYRLEWEVSPIDSERRSKQDRESRQSGTASRSMSEGGDSETQDKLPGEPLVALGMQRGTSQASKFSSRRNGQDVDDSQLGQPSNDQNMPETSTTACKTPALGNNPTRAHGAPVGGGSQVTGPASAATVPFRRPNLTAQGGRRGSFEEFVAGDNSSFAFSASQHVISRLGEISPLFIHGPTGVGKTHLLQSICGAVRKSSRARSLLLSSEQFTSSFLEALRGHGLPSFRRKYRQTDVLVLDDIQFFVGKRATLVELTQTLDALVQDGKQVVLAADRPPNELKGVGDEIIARLSAGLVCGIEYPQRETKLELVQTLAMQRGQSLSPEICEMLADELPGDARRIKGALNRISVLTLAVKGELSLERVRRELSDLLQANQRPVVLQDIERAVCEVFGVDGKQLRSNRKTKNVSQPRMLAMWLARKHTRAAFSEIGDYFGGRSHSTVISAHHKVESWVGTDADIRLASGDSKVNDAIRRIESNLKAM